MCVEGLDDDAAGRLGFGDQDTDRRAGDAVRTRLPLRRGLPLFFFLSFPRLPDEISCLFPLDGDPPSRGFRSPLNRGGRSVAETEPIWLVGWFGCFRVAFFFLVEMQMISFHPGISFFFG
jgi:hypothetical protein